ncbi:MAG: hypothetical protein ACRDJP_15965 [Actinomycetota bacterium]
MRIVWLTWGLCSLMGGVIIALPDRGPRLFSLSRTHGPSAVDGLGIALLLAGWLTLMLAVWRRRARLAAVAPRSARIAGVAAMVAGAVVLVATIRADAGAWWTVGVAMLAIPQIAAAIVVSRGASERGSRSGA